MGRRSPGRRGGRAPGADCGGRERWKIGFPGSGRPGAGRDTAPAEAIGAFDAGRGPVWGMMTRGGALAAIGGLDAAACNCDGCAVGGGATGVCAAGAAGRGGIATAAGGAGLGLGGATAVGLGVTIAAGGRDAATEAGVTNFGAAVSAAGLDGTDGL